MKKHFRIGLLLSLSLLVCAACLCTTVNAATSYPLESATLTVDTKAPAKATLENNYNGSVKLSFETQATHYVYKGVYKKVGKKKVLKYNLTKTTNNATLTVSKLSKTKKTYFKVVDKVKYEGKTYASKEKKLSALAGPKGFHMNVYYQVSRLGPIFTLNVFIMNVDNQFRAQSNKVSKVVVKRATKKNGKYKALYSFSVKKAWWEDPADIPFQDGTVANGKTYYYKFTPYMGKSKCQTTTVKVKEKDGNTNIGF